VKLNGEQKRAITAGGHTALCRALIIERQRPSGLSPAAMTRFTPAVRNEIERGLRLLPGIRSSRTEKLPWNTMALTSRALIESKDAIFWDQAVWEHLDTPDDKIVDTLTRLLAGAPTLENQVSILLAIAHAAHKSPQSAADFLESVSNDKTAIELSEWATLLLREMVSIATRDMRAIDTAVSERPWEFTPGKRFDVVLPLMFAGYSTTRVGSVIKKTVISPLWFYKVFGRATALVRSVSLASDLIIEKRMEGLNPDGSPHFEVFPFSGETSRLSDAVLSHNYWAELKRPFYSSGRTGYVGAGQHVIQGVPMTFSRSAETASPPRYWDGDLRLVETTRGIFFGTGHVDVELLIRNRFDLQAGHLQLCNSVNPITGEPANTEFYGTFYGKVSDWNGDGKLDFNSLPVHSTVDGKVDYDGDGTNRPTTLRPQDWQ